MNDSLTPERDALFATLEQQGHIKIFGIVGVPGPSGIYGIYGWQTGDGRRAIVTETYEGDIVLYEPQGDGERANRVADLMFQKAATHAKNTVDALENLIQAAEESGVDDKLHVEISDGYQVIADYKAATYACGKCGATQEQHNCPGAELEQ